MSINDDENGQKPYKYIENDKSKTILLKLTSAQALQTDYQDLKPEGWFIKIKSTFYRIYLT